MLEGEADQRQAAARAILVSKDRPLATCRARHVTNESVLRKTLRNGALTNRNRYLGYLGYRPRKCQCHRNHANTPPAATSSH